MTVDMVVVFALLLVAIVLFATERVSFDVTAAIIVGTLMVTGIVTPAQGFSGFSNLATVTIAAMFVISASLHRTGALDRVGALFSAWGRQDSRKALIGMMVAIAVISAFINNTAAVAIFIPVVVGVATDLGISPSRVLMPLSFASMFGGVCTLIGTSTNILVSSIARDQGLGGFGVFEFAPLGLILLAVGFLYLFLGGMRLIPERRRDHELTSSYEMHPYLTDVVLEPGFDEGVDALHASDLTAGRDLDVLQVVKGEDRLAPHDDVTLEVGDVLRIRGSAVEIEKLVRREYLSLRPPREWSDVDFESEVETLVEAVIAPDSPLASTPIENAEFLQRFGAVLLAIRHHGRLQQEDLGKVRLAGGDSVLLSIEPERVPELERDASVVLVSEVGVPRRRRERLPVAVSILIAVVLSAAVGWVPIAVSAFVGCVLIVLTGCLSTEEAYRSINWKVIFLLAGVLPLGTAMEQTGAASLLSDHILGGLGEWGPRAVLSGFFFLSMMLTNVISNQATAALLAPIAIQSAQALDVSARPLLLAVAFAASLSFMTPVGYQTNTLIYGPGQYRFHDFLRVGTPLNLIFWAVATWLIPVFWPL